MRTRSKGPNSYPENSERFGNVQIYYRDYYSRVIGKNASRLLGALSSYPHRLIEKNKENFQMRILEIGAGEGEHTKYVKKGYIEYILTDIDEHRLAKANLDEPGMSTKVMSATNLQYLDETFDRVIVTCVLAHLANAEQVLVEWKRVLKTGGNLSIYIPCEPGIALRLFRKLVSERKAKSLGFAGYPLLIARDHINSASNLMTFVSHVFRESDVRFKNRPFPIPTWYFNLFSIIEIKK